MNEIPIGFEPVVVMLLCIVMYYTIKGFISMIIDKPEMLIITLVLIGVVALIGGI